LSALLGDRPFDWDSLVQSFRDVLAGPGFFEATVRQLQAERRESLLLAEHGSVQVEMALTCNCRGAARHIEVSIRACEVASAVLREMKNSRAM
jgi:hypothetical protein